ncbi:MAG TPA: S41 family peptidase [Phycisphaerae bacterium]|nr:S41 family peptidase [Phycisphaerae bacterium]
MSNSPRSFARIVAIIIPLAVGGALALHHASAQTEQPEKAATAQTSQAQAAVFDYADQITRLVENQKIDELAHLNLPPAGAEAVKLGDWAKSYAGEIQQQETERTKEYSDEVAKAQDYFKQDKFDESMAQVVQAYTIAKDQAAFLNLDWVKDLTAKVAKRASDFEQQGNWIESLQLYTDLNSLYEIDTRYKADTQRLARRVRLLALYTPKTLFDMRKALDEKTAKEDGTTLPADSAADAAATFPDWHDYVEGITFDMCHDSLTRARNDWVEQTSYDTLIQGGVDSLRLFLTTPELAKEFPGLGDAQARDEFAKTLDGALAKPADGKDLDSDDVDRILKGLVASSEQTVKLPANVILMEFTDGAMEKLDPFTAVIWPHEKPEFDKQTRGNFGGVGIQISLDNAQLKVISPLEDTPAFKAGIQANDVITAINGKSTVGITIDQAVQAIMGDPGTTVDLKIKRSGQPDKDYQLQRAIIHVSSVKGFRRDPSDESQTRWDFMLDPTNKIGYIRITGFQDDTSEELRTALESLKQQGMRGLILDLRFNPGGLLTQAIDISDMFLQKGVIVSTRGRSENVRPTIARAHEDTVVPPTMPLTVLVNQYSASASEIFSGAMKDLHRALIVGHRSFGKGSVQNLIPIGGDVLNPKAFIKLTTSYYYLPDGESLHRRDGNTKWGVDPDVAVDLTPKQLNDLLTQRRDSDIIHNGPATSPATTTAAQDDTQLDTALLMMRLQLVQSHA